MRITTVLSIVAATVLTVAGGIVAGRTASGLVLYASFILAMAAASPAVVRLEQWDYDRRQAQKQRDTAGRTAAPNGARER